MIYEYVDVKDKVVEWLRANINIRVTKGDPREHVEIPCIGVNRVGDDETSQVLGDDLETVQIEEKYVHFRGTFFHESLEARIWHFNADERDKLFTQLKAQLFALRDELVALGVINITLRGGRDEQDNTFPPQPLYWATITMSYLNPLSVQTDDVLTEIDNINVRTVI